MVYAALRLFSSVVRLFFYIWLGKYYSLVLVADIALVNATLGILLFLLPFDYYISLQASYAKSEGGKVESINHLAFLLAVSILFLIVSTLISVLSGEMVVILVSSIIIFEIFNHEINRILILKGRLSLSSWNMFIRMALWPIVIVFLYYCDVILSLPEIFILWMSSSIAAIVYLIVKLDFYKLSYGEYVSYLSFKEMRYRLIQGSKNILSSVFVRLHLTLDKYIVVGAFGKEMLGVYQITLSICSALIILTDAVIVPRHYSLYFSGQTSTRVMLMRFMKEVFVFYALLVFLLVILVHLEVVLSIGLFHDSLLNALIILTSQLIFIFNYPLNYTLTKNNEFISNSLASGLSFVIFLFFSACVLVIEMEFIYFILGVMCSLLVSPLFKLWVLKKNEY